MLHELLNWTLHIDAVGAGFLEELCKEATAGDASGEVRTVSMVHVHVHAHNVFSVSAHELSG